MDLYADLLDRQRLEQLQIEHPPQPKRFRQLIKEASAELKARFLQGVPAIELVYERARIIDQLLHCIWQHFIPDDIDTLALIAVGGYGRGELHPGSDIDIMILLQDNDHTLHQEKLEQLITFLWDLGLEIGHSVRSLDECFIEGKKDITVATNLMEARLLAGPQTLFEAMTLQVGPDKIWPTRDFFKAKWEEQIQRHAKFNDTAYNLEPNIKEGPGGLRDIQMIGWVTKRHFGTNTLHDLVNHQFLTENEYEMLIEGQNFLWRVRFALHALIGRREDRLLFDHQRTLAEQFGFHDSATEGLAIEQFMRRYYCTIMELSRLNEMLLQHFQEVILYKDDHGKPQQLNRRFQLRKGFIEVNADDVFRETPSALLELFLLLQQQPEIKGVRAATIRLMRNHRYLIDEAFRNDPHNRHLFMEIIRQPRGLTHELRRMNRYGILANYLPAFGKIVGLMQYDLFHVYTVDEHTLMVVRNLRRMTLSEHAHELPFCSKLITTIPKPEVLHLAGLFHDIAKGRGGNHSLLGEDEARAFCLHHEMSRDDADLVAWLVRNHLIMSSTAQRKDINDPEVIREFAIQVIDQKHLDYLYLLTMADIRATGPTVWNNWKDSLLQNLYRNCKSALRRGVENPLKQSERLAAIQQQSRQLLLQQRVSAAAIEALWQRLGSDYFLRHSSEEIVWQCAGIIENGNRELPLVMVMQEAQRGGTEVFIYSPHKDYIFATLALTLDQMGLTIVDARIISSNDNYTFDTFVIHEEDGAPITSGQRIEEIIKRLKTALSTPQKLKRSVTRRTARQLKHFTTKTQIRFSHDERNQYTVMELISADRPGLLANIGRALMECRLSLHTAKISTIGERADDVLFITDSENRPLTEAAAEALRQRIIELLDTPS